MSDIGNKGFEPIDLNSLDRFDEEHSSSRNKANPDFDRFEMLFEASTFDKEETDKFELLYDVGKESEEAIFTPLIKRDDTSSEKDEMKAEGQSSKDTSTGDEVVKTVEETPEEKGYRKGFEQGLKEGTLQGHEKGYEEGLRKGEAKGRKKGEEQGIEQGIKQGIEQGLKEGEEKAAADTREKAVEILNSLEESLKKADQTLDLLVEKYEERIISLVQQIAEKVVMARVEMDDEIIRNLIVDALKALSNPEEVVLSICPEDYDYIEMIKDEFFETIESLKSVSVRSDVSIKRGGCKIDTATASISTDPQSKLDAIFEAIKKAALK